jgi:2-iminobutanoate/2-iminopropanoate deaminase
MTKTAVRTQTAPVPVAPYSQAIIANGLIFTAGQTGTSLETKKLVEGVSAQTKQVLTHVKAILEAAGSSLDKVVKTTVFLADMNDFAAMNEVYGTFFTGDTPPARSTVQVARLPGDALVEIETVALV